MPCWVLDPNSEHRMGVQNGNPTKAMAVAVAVAANAAWDCGWSDCQYRNWLIVAQSLSVTCVDCTHCVLLISLCVHVHMFCPTPLLPLRVPPALADAGYTPISSIRNVHMEMVSRSVCIQYLLGMRYSNHRAALHFTSLGVYTRHTPLSTQSPLERTLKMTTTRSTKKKKRMKKKMYFALSVHLNRFIRPQLVSARVAGGPHNHRKCRRCCHPQWHRNRSQTAGNVYRKRITGKLNQYNCNSIIVALIIERRRLSHAQQTQTHTWTHTYTLTYTLPRVYAALSFRWLQLQLQLQLQLRVRLTISSKCIFPFSARFHSVHSKTFSKHTHTCTHTRGR